jgi:hypothetical protein
MQYDSEYNSYRFSSTDMIIMLNALEFYQQYNPSEQATSSYISVLINDLQKSRQVPDQV